MKLLDFCKCSVLCIVNGRIDKDNPGKLTCCISKCVSVVDYNLMSSNLFHIITEFEVRNFTVHSDHASLCVKLKCDINLENRAETRISKVIRWSDDNTSDQLNRCSDQFQSITATNENTRLIENEIDHMQVFLHI